MHNIDHFAIVPLHFLQIHASWWVNVFHYWTPPCNKIDSHIGRSRNLHYIQGLNN
jgi:hypothetical protein